MKYVLMTENPTLAFVHISNALYIRRCLLDYASGLFDKIQRLIKIAVNHSSNNRFSLFTANKNEVSKINPLKS